MDISERINIVEDRVKKVKKLEKDIYRLKDFIKFLDNSISPNDRYYIKFIPTSLTPRIIEWAKEELDKKLEELKSMLIREG